MKLALARAIIARLESRLKAPQVPTDDNVRCPCGCRKVVGMPVSRIMRSDARRRQVTA